MKGAVVMRVDDDVKIYEQPETTSFPVSEGEKSADIYLKHKENGNLDKCKEMGQQLAKLFLEHTTRFIDKDFYSQTMVLIAFVLDAQFNDDIYDSILLTSTHSRFHNIIETQNIDLFKIITDNTAFTLYTLNERSGCISCLGDTFAQLCDRDNDQSLKDYALTLIDEYSNLFDGIIHSYTFI